MNNEPVAWMSQGGDVSRSADYFVEMGFTDLIPLYTHPVKEHAQYDRGFDAGVKHGKTIYQAEIEALKEFYIPKENEGDFKTVSRKELLDYIEWLRQANTKALTDEEIWKCHDETDSDNWVIEFARAILRKASEK
jgi:hypothetical protein